MREIDFPYPKLNRPIPTGNAELDFKNAYYFELIKNYKNDIKAYIYTDIQISYAKGDERRALSRVQQIMSSALLRSLYLRNGVVDAINSRNIVSLFAVIKSFVEVPALLAYTYSVLDQMEDEDIILESLAKIVFGDRGDGHLRAGRIDAVNVKTMFEKLDAYLAKRHHSTIDNKKCGIMMDFYGLVCNAAHPCYEAHDIIGDFDEEHAAWRGKTANEVRQQISNEYLYFGPPLLTSIDCIKLLCSSICEHEGIEHFNKLNSPNYFE